MISLFNNRKFILINYCELPSSWALRPTNLKGQGIISVNGY